MLSTSQLQELRNPTYLGLKKDFWGCYYCHTHNGITDKKCWNCKKDKGFIPLNHWSISSKLKETHET